MKITALLNAKYFALAMLFQSKVETRYYLNGVFVEPHPDGGVTMVATDGHRLAAFRDQDGFIDEARIVQMPRAFRNSALKPSRGYLALFESPTNRGCQAHVFDASGINDDAEGLDEMIADVTAERVKWIGAATYINGTFPNWRGVVPKMPDDPAPPPLLCVDGYQVADFQEVANRAAFSEVSIIPSTPGGAMIVQCGNDSFIGILMPRRDSASFERAIHSWVMKRPEAAQPSDLVDNQEVA
ncbi:MAG TPA: hypothetical protein PLV07_13370 [Acidiphilium sp.]|nr:hypothetical protein [Acidiphilium sp.]